jgi:hypothetical protein
MIVYTLDETDILEIFEAFGNLGIEPSADKSKIKSAWKKKVSDFHPDKAKNEDENKLFHHKFIELGKARDLCLEATEIDDLITQLKSAKEDFSKPEQEKKEIVEDNYLQEEWMRFVKDENSYFNIINSSILSISSVLKLILFSFLFAIGTITLFAIIISGLLNIFTSHLKISIIGWIFGITLSIIIAFQIQDNFKKLEDNTLETLSKTGFPLATFFIIWGSINLISVLLLLYQKDVSFLLFVSSNFLLMFLYNSLNQKMYLIQEGLTKLRNRFSSEEIVIRAKNRFKAS